MGATVGSVPLWGHLHFRDPCTSVGVELWLAAGAERALQSRYSQAWRPTKRAERPGGAEAGRVPHLRIIVTAAREAILPRFRREAVVPPRAYGYGLLPGPNARCRADDCMMWVA